MIKPIYTNYLNNSKKNYDQQQTNNKNIAFGMNKADAAKKVLTALQINRGRILTEPLDNLRIQVGLNKTPLETLFDGRKQPLIDIEKYVTNFPIISELKMLQSKYAANSSTRCAENLANRGLSNIFNNGEITITDFLLTTRIDYETQLRVFAKYGKDGIPQHHDVILSLYSSRLDLPRLTNQIKEGIKGVIPKVLEDELLRTITGSKNNFVDNSVLPALPPYAQVNSGFLGINFKRTI